MSQNNEPEADWPIQMIKISVGVVIFVFLSILLTQWELQRSDILGTTTPGALAYVLIPLLVGLLVIGANFVIQGASALTMMWIGSLRTENPE